jgi:ubiquinol-cytochrome c reductase cytochrome c subunit
MKQLAACPGRRVFLLLLLLLAPAILAPPTATARSTRAAGPAEDVVRYGRDLFAGRAAMQNGGPPCAACHATSAIPFPHGGRMGPDLSAVYQMLGPEGTDVTLRTLFFPTMMPIYQDRPLTGAERRALAAFFAQSAAGPAGERDTLVVAALAGVGFLLLAALTWLTWGRRLRGVRAALVARAVAEGRRP